ncbi:MAG TPA: translation initiation factor IF-1 [Pyrinomonadaceae bacterium]|jgi:translation initiation factor IF-1|nr:translation initiation factor IF-1 [Pyrinomonadaceae bacterium]
MANESSIKVNCTVLEPLVGGVFRVEQDDGREVLARVSGKRMKHFVRILPGDCVVVEMSPSDLNRGLIVSRCKQK